MAMKYDENLSSRDFIVVMHYIRTKIEDRKKKKRFNVSNGTASTWALMPYGCMHGSASSHLTKYIHTLFHSVDIPAFIASHLFESGIEFQNECING